MPMPPIGPTTRALLARGRGGRGTEGHVQRRNRHGRGLTPEDMARNALICAGGERYFAHCKQVWGMGRTRMKGPVRNRALWAMAALT
jgi:hypothetical protein